MESVRESLTKLDPASADYAVGFVESLLAACRQYHASDVHLQPTAAGLDVRWRIDGVLHSLGTFAAGERADPVSRLKVMAELLTYRRDIPQEGRLRDGPPGVEMRVSTFPTLRGERAVVRLFLTEDKPWHLEDLGLPLEVGRLWHQKLGDTSGGLLICGPAGSGKTTTAYASLRQIVQDSGASRSIVSIEDPIEVELPGVAQSQVNAAAGLDLTTGLRSLLRQDPEVIFVGEIRDPATAEIALQAALTGQLMVTTFHATSAAAAISRLHDMDLEPYVLRSGIRAILNQRLVRRLCSCKRPLTCRDDWLGWKVTAAWTAAGCPLCQDTGYRGRVVLAELLLPDHSETGRQLLSRRSAAQIEALAVELGMRSRWQRAAEAIEQGLTSPSEARRVLGLDPSRAPPASGPAEQ